MQVNILREAGYEEALLGMALSYYDHATPIREFWIEEKRQRATQRAKSLAFKGGGHSKFLESIQLWVYVQASRSFWSEMDTYRVGISKQSASTMHTLMKRQTTHKDYEEGTSLHAIAALNTVLEQTKDITTVKDNLPEGWLQERILCLNYKCLQNIVAQRKDHRLKHWKTFCAAILEQAKHPEFLHEGRIENKIVPNQTNPDPVRDEYERKCRETGYTDRFDVQVQNPDVRTRDIHHDKRHPDRGEKAPVRVVYKHKGHRALHMDHHRDTAYLSDVPERWGRFIHD